MSARQRHRAELARELAARGLRLYDYIAELEEHRELLVAYNAWLEAEIARLRTALRERTWEAAS